MIETVSFASLAGIRHSFHPLPFSAEARALALYKSPRNLQGVFLPEFMRGDFLHPYMGFGLGPPTPQDDLGFRNTVSPLQQKSSEKFVVGVFGGSVAYQLHEYGLEALKAELLKIPELSQKEMVFIRISVGGFKQPQQLMALNYLLNLGGEFDLIINVDGFNEVALPLSENIPSGVSPLYPRHWFARVGSYSFPSLRLAMSVGFWDQKIRGHSARIFSAPVLSKSPAMNLLWEALDHLFQIIHGKMRQFTNHYKVTPADYEASGPQMLFSNEAALFEFMAKIWARSSLLMSQISQANGILYFHFLQPNQYFAGSKVLSPEEEKTAFKKNHIYRKGVEKGYPFLKQQAGTLLTPVHYFDLSLLYAGEKETIYVDDCCHYNQKGYDLLAREIGRIVRENFSKGI